MLFKYQLNLISNILYIIALKYQLNLFQKILYEWPLLAQSTHKPLKSACLKAVCEDN